MGGLMILRLWENCPIFKTWTLQYSGVKYVTYNLFSNDSVKIYTQIKWQNVKNGLSQVHMIITCSILSLFCVL